MNEEIKNNITTENKDTDTTAMLGESGTINPDSKKKATGGNVGVYVHRFKKPFEYEGTKHVTLNFCFERLSGKDMIAIEMEMQANNEYVIAPEISKSFQCKLASRAGGIGSDVIENMPFKDFNKITIAARDFLLANSDD